MGSWSGTGQLARAVAALPGTTCVFAKNNNESIVLILITNKQTNKEPNKMNQVPVRPQRGLVPFSKEPKEPFFSSTWDEFDQMRNQMMEKNHGFWDKVDQDMKEFEKCVSQMETDMDNANAPLRPSVPSWALPEDHKKNWPMIGNCTESGRSECEVVKLETTESKWEVELDVAKFKPEDLKVAVVGDLVTISGSQTEQFIGNDTSSNTVRSFTKRYTLPSGCDPDPLSSSLTVSGNLKVTCPRKKWLTGPSAKAIRYN